MKKITKIVLICVGYLLLIGIYGFLDYKNVFNSFSFNFNSNFLGVFISALTSIFIFIVSYILIDRRISDNENAKKHNREISLYLMLDDTYFNCKEAYKIFNNNELLTKYIVPKVKKDKINDEFLEFQKNRLFKYDSKIMDLVSVGIVDQTSLKLYLSIKNDMIAFMNMEVALYDINSLRWQGNDKALKAKKELDSLNKKLGKNLDTAINDIKKKLGE